MKRRVGTRLLSSIPLLLVSGLGGCYAHHTADEELLDISFPDEVYPDAGAPVADAGSTTACTQTDPIQLLICQFSQGGGTGGFNIPGLTGTGTGTTGTTSQTPDLSGLTDLIGLLGGGTTGTGSTSNTNGLQGLIDLFGNLQGGQTGTTGTTGQVPNIQDILSQFGISSRDAGTTQQMTGVTAAQCASATDAQTRFMCVLSGYATPNQGRDAGAGRTGFTWPPTRGTATSDAGVPETLL